MTDTAWEKLSALTGVLFGALMLIAVGIQGQLPNIDVSNAAALNFFADTDKEITQALYIRLFAGFAFVWWLGTLRSMLARAEGGTGRLAAVAFGSGLINLAAGIMAFATMAAGAHRVDHGLSADVSGSLLSMTHTLYAVGGVATAWLLVATFVVIKRTNVLPAWTGWWALVTAVIFLVAPIARFGEPTGLAGFPFFFVWVVIVSLGMWMGWGHEDDKAVAVKP